MYIYILFVFQNKIFPTYECQKHAYLKLEHGKLASFKTAKEKGIEYKNLNGGHLFGIRTT